MSWYKRFQMTVGILFVLALLAGLCVYLNYSMSHVASRSAQLMANTYTVGTDYSGIIVKQYVQEGQHVTTGQSLFEIKSGNLVSDINSGVLRPNEAGLTINGSNNLVLKATANGSISNIRYLEGAYVPANSEIAEITKAGSTYVIAKYQLAKPDYSLLNQGTSMSVTLPNGQRLTGTVFDISVESIDNITYTVVKARLSDASSNIRFAAGTPVDTQLDLVGKSLVTSFLDNVEKLFKPHS